MKAKDTLGVWETMMTQAKYRNNDKAVCERWKNYNNFLKDMGPRPKGLVLGRIDEEVPFCVINCAWVKPGNKSGMTRNHTEYTQTERLGLAYDTFTKSREKVALNGAFRNLEEKLMVEKEAKTKRTNRFIKQYAKLAIDPVKQEKVLNELEVFKAQVGEWRAYYSEELPVKINDLLLSLQEREQELRLLDEEIGEAINKRRA